MDFSVAERCRSLCNNDKNVASAELRLLKGHVRSTERVVTYFADFTSYFDDSAAQDWNLFMLKEDISLC